MLDLNKRKPIHKDKFHGHVMGLTEGEGKGFDEEFKSIPMSTGTPHTVGSLAENKQKNRFLNIFPYDTSRVKLMTYNDSDYINACFVDVRYFIYSHTLTLHAY
jgi:protein tyrosine phosphatase